METIKIKTQENANNLFNYHILKDVVFLFYNLLISLKKERKKNKKHLDNQKIFCYSFL